MSDPKAHPSELGTEATSALSKIRTALRWLLAFAFVVQGVNHFVSDDLMVRMMPHWLPAHRELVWLSGLAEILLGLGVLWPRTRRFAGWGLLLLLVAVWPANWAMALRSDEWPEAPAWMLWARLPFQFLFAYWVYATCLRRDASKTATRPAA